LFLAVNGQDTGYIVKRKIHNILRDPTHLIILANVRTRIIIKQTNAMFAQIIRIPSKKRNLNDLIIAYV
jgi:hypothetical protein